MKHKLDALIWFRGPGLIQIELSPLEAMSKECTDCEAVSPKGPLLWL